jgi:hypothetical protein
LIETIPAVEDPKKAKLLAYFSTSKLDASRGSLGATSGLANGGAGLSRRQLFANAAIAASRVGS